MARFIQLEQAQLPGELPNAKIGSTSQQASGADFGAGVGQALQGVGDQIGRAAAIYQQDQEQRQNFERQEWLARFSASEEMRLEQERAANQGSLAQGFTKNFMAVHDAEVGKFLTAIPEREQAQWSARLQGVRGNLSVAAFRTELKNTADAYEAKTSMAIEDSAKIVLTNPAYAAVAKAQIGALIDANPIYSPEQKEIAKRKAFEDLEVKSIQAEIEGGNADSVAATLGGTSSYIDALTRQESGGNPAAKASTSSATGLFQFIDKTWNTIANSDAGKAAGLRPLGEGKDPRLDPAQQRKALQIAMRQDAQTLARIGLKATGKNMYMMHFMGGPNGSKFLMEMQKDPAQSAAKLFPSAAAANPTIFGNGRTLGQVFAVQTRRFSDALALGPDGKEYKDLSADTRLKVKELAERQSAEDARLASAKANDDYKVWWNDVQNGLMDGRYGKADVESWRKSGQLLDAEDARQAFNLIEDYNKREGDLRNGEAALSTEGFAWNPYDKAHNKTVEGLVKARGNTPAAAFEIWGRTGILADSGAVALRGGLISTKPEAVAASANIVSNMLTKNPNAFAGVTGSNEIEKAGLMFGHFVNELGLTSEQAAAKVAEMNSPEFKSRAGVKDIAAQAFKTDLSKNVLPSLAKEFSFDAAGFAGQNRGALQALTADYADLALMRYDETGDPALARSYAKSVVDKMYGVSNGVFMKYPPEKSYPAVGGSHEYVQQQAVSFAKSRTKLDVTPESIRLVPLPTITPEAFKTGKPVPYGVLIVKEVDGQPIYEAVPPTKGTGMAVFTANPGAAKAAYSDFLRAKEEKRNTDMDAATRGLLQNPTVFP